MATDCSQQLTFWDLGSQQITADFNGGRVVTDAGLLPLRLLDKKLGVLRTIAARLPDPRAQRTQLLNFGSTPNSRRLQSPPWCSGGARDPGPTLVGESTRMAPVFGLHSVPVALDRHCAERREY